MPASSSSSRHAVAAWSASSACMAPPGNTHAPPMKRCSGLRLHEQHLAAPSAASRSRISEAAWRASVTSPSIDSSPRRRSMRTGQPTGERARLPARERDRDHPAVDLHLLRVHLRPRRGRPRRRASRPAPPSRTSRTTGSARSAGRASATSSPTRARRGPGRSGRAHCSQDTAAWSPPFIARFVCQLISGQTNVCLWCKGSVAGRAASPSRRPAVPGLRPPPRGPARSPWPRRSPLR